MFDAAARRRFEQSALPRKDRLADRGQFDRRRSADRNPADRKSAG
ncbi:hypothetical protein HMPREF0972_01877 [Actinomyces sp. oral taxon 848 str. F0332]|nr:hypothetical protein HMPREF0972_01877 [Actinomyces sp. oral taxon 848 str. F0332]